MSGALEEYYEEGDVYLSLVKQAKGKLELWIYLGNEDISLNQVEKTVREHFCDSPWLVFKEADMVYE